jgi:hypothetical protein
MDKNLEEFIEYSKSHPELSFWQALLEWSKEKHDGAFSALLMEKNGRLYNTINWTGEDSPMILFGNEVKK